MGDGSDRVIGALSGVHRTLGPGLLESAYEACFCQELQVLGIPVERQLSVHSAQVLTYMKLLGAPVGLLANF